MLFACNASRDRKGREKSDGLNQATKDASSAFPYNMICEGRIYVKQSVRYE